MPDKLIRNSAIYGVIGASLMTLFLLLSGVPIDILNMLVGAAIGTGLGILVVYSIARVISRIREK